MKKLVLFTAVLGLAVMVAACGGASAAVTPTSTPVQAASAPAAEAAAISAPAAESVTAPTAAPQQATEVVAQPEAAPAVAAPVEATGSDADTTTAPAVVANTKLNLNEATGDDYLAAIPAFSSRMVREFLEYRPYVSIQQFRREIGKYVGDDVVAGYEQYVYVPVAVNESDAETLKQLPGVDDAIAAQLIAGRPYDSNAAFLARLAQLVSSQDAAAAAGYLAQP